MIITIGYGALQPEGLEGIVRKIKATHRGAKLVDVRVKPVSRRPGFGRRQLEERFGDLYEWRGDILGGRGRAAWPLGLPHLAEAHQQGQTPILLCQEEAPGDCHRHQIAIKLWSYGIPVWHVFQDTVVKAWDLEQAIEEDSEYDCFPIARILR